MPRPALAVARDRLAPGGALVVWSSHRAPGLLAALREVAGQRDRVQERTVTVHREGRTVDYGLYTLIRRE